MAGSEVAPVRTCGPMVPQRHRVRAVRRELADTVTLALEPVEGRAGDGLHAGGRCAPGQFNMLWAFGAGEVPISVSELIGADGMVRHTVRAVGMTTAALGEAEVGDVIGVRGPFGIGWDLDAARDRDVVIMAGGIGLAPLRPVVSAVLAERRTFGSVAVLAGSRSPDAVLYHDELRAWTERTDLDTWVTVDHAGRDWWGEVGVVTGLLDHVSFDPAATVAFVCGPEIMVRFAAAALIARGVAPPSIQVSLERNMHCAVAHCGRCQLGPTLVCRDGPVYPYDVAGPLLAVRGR
jgi:NAD(P)H-flavin reductase